MERDCRNLVQKIEWNDKLHQSAHVQASEMYQHNFFAHFSKEGLNIGERLEKAGYIWMVAEKILVKVKNHLKKYSMTD